MAKPVWQGSTGAQSFATAANFSTGAVPATGDELIFSSGTSLITSGLLSAAVLASLTHYQGFTGDIGFAPETTLVVSGITRSSTTATVTTVADHGYLNGDVVEIRGCAEANYNGTFTIANKAAKTFEITVTDAGDSPAAASAKSVCKTNCLNVAASIVTLGQSNPTNLNLTGSGRIKLNLGTTATAVTVLNSATADDAGAEAVQLRLINVANTVTVAGGTVGIATERPGDASTVATLSITGTSATANLGSGVTWTNINQTKGYASIQSGGASTVITQQGGILTGLPGTYELGTVSVAGRMNLNNGNGATQAVDICTVLPGGTLDVSGAGAIKIGDLYVYPGSRIITAPAYNLTVDTMHYVNVGSLTYA